MMSSLGSDSRANLTFLDHIKGVLLRRKLPGLQAMLDHVQDVVDTACAHIGCHSLPSLHCALDVTGDRASASIGESNHMYSRCSKQSCPSSLPLLNITAGHRGLIAKFG